MVGWESCTFVTHKNAAGVALQDPEVVDFERAWLGSLWVPEHGLGRSRATSERPSKGLVGPHRIWLAGLGGRGWTVD